MIAQEHQRRVGPSSRGGTEVSDSRPMRRRAVVALFLTATTVLAGALTPLPSQAKHPSVSPADTVLLDGKVLRYTPGGKAWARAVAVRGQRIVFVGSNAGASRFIGPDTRVIDLDGHMLMPGLGDGHLHGQGYVQCNLGYQGGTVEQVLAKLRACLLRPDQAEYLASDYRLTAFFFNGEAMQPVGTQLDRTILDRLSASPEDDPFGTGTSRPIVVKNSDFHKSYTNSVAITHAGITASTDPGGGFIGIGPDGQPNGQFSDFSADWGPELPAPTDAAYLAKSGNIDEMNSKGITSIVQPRGLESDLQIWRRLADDGELTVRVNQAIWVTRQVRGVSDPAAIDMVVDAANTLRQTYDGYSSPASPGSLAVDTVKIHCDGVAEFPAQTAAMLEPYNENVGTAEDPEWVPTGNRGEDPSCEDATAAFDKFDEAKWNIHVHAIGDRATRVALDNFAAAKRENPRWHRRNTITHLQFVAPSDVARFARLHVTANMSLQWARRDSYSVDAIEGYVNDRVAGNMYPARDLLNAGVKLSAGSDWPVDPLLPWLQVETAVTRSGDPDPEAGIYEGPLVPSNGISLLESLKASTVGVAYQMGEEKHLGAIAQGMYADFIVLDQNLFDIPISSVSDTEVLLTVVGGQIVYADPTSPLTL